MIFFARLFWPIALIVSALFSLHDSQAQQPYYRPDVRNWAQTTAPTESPTYTLFLLGDAGSPKAEPLEPAFRLLKSQMDREQARSGIAYLGDNIYQHGLPDSLHPEFAEAEGYLRTQLQLLDGYQGKAVIVPGNHDWGQGRKYGWENNNNQERYVEQYLNGANAFLPDNGCPGPVEVPLADDLVLLAINTQWWLHPWDKPAGENSDCEAKTKEEFLLLLQDAVARNRHKKIVVVAHHPMYSNGTHGGHVPLRYHLFPLTDIKEKAYVPLPGLGSVYVFYRTVMGNIQDIPHPDYQAMRKGMLAIFATHPNLIYANGHDHSLQYHYQKGLHFVTSGGGCKTDPIKRHPQAEFAMGTKGFSRVNFYQNGDVWLEHWVPEGDGQSGKVVYRRKLFNQPAPPPESLTATSLPSFQGQTATAAATQTLKAKGLKKWMLGENYRKEWAQLIQAVPVFDLATEKGGLTVVQKGGGMQTKSLRLLAPDGKEYALRSIEKFPDAAVPAMLRGTVAADIVKDQISASHPYGAFAVPPLASAFGVYHTNPKLVYLPDDPRLGEYRSLFSSGLYLFEERPADDWSDSPNFGNSKKIVSTFKMIDNLMADNDDVVDQQQVLRSRLFDMWIGDWDRHDDQWRWATSKQKGVTYYQPIPRDRDQAFFNAGGLIMTVGTRKWGMRKFQGFKHHLRDPAGLAFNARYFDRSFLTEPNWADWEKMAKALQTTMTDSLIGSAVRQLPADVFPHHGQLIAEKLGARRNRLLEYARTFYLALSRDVDVLGSDKHELFRVERLNDQQTRVRVWKIKKDGEREHKLYDRTFENKETREIRLYGFGGEDRFEIGGEVKKAIKIRIIGGKGQDSVTDSSQVAGPSKKTWVYDEMGKNQLQLGREGKDLTSDDPNVNFYDRKAFQFDVMAPAAAFAFNPDDGVFLGGGLNITRHGFRKSPYKSQQVITANVAPVTRSFNFIYKGEFVRLLGKFDLLMEADWKSPSFVDFFYGLGNETLNERDTKGRQYYRVRYEQLLLNPTLRRSLSGGKQQFFFGLNFQSIELDDPGDLEAGQTRYIFEEFPLPPGTDPEEYFDERRTFLGVNMGYKADLRDNPVLPTRGLLFEWNSARITGTEDEDRDEINFWRHQGNLALYFSFGKRFRTTFATRIGGAINSGDYMEIYQANTLGASTNLRGFRRMRFAGDRSFYNNNEVRMKLFNIKTYLFPAEMGIHGFFDTGRVWVKNDPSTPTGTSNEWHQGYGGGVWLSPFAKAVFSLDLSRSVEEELLPFIRFGFMF